MGYGDPIAAIGSQSQTYDYRGNLRGIKVKGFITHGNRHCKSHCSAPDPTIGQDFFLNPMTLLESFEALPVWS
jgi:hypothetical protein